MAVLLSLWGGTVGASEVARDKEPACQCRRRRQWHPTPVLLPGKSHGCGGAWKAAVHGIAEGQTWLSDFTFTFHFHALEEMATYSSVLVWRIPGMGHPGGLPSIGSQRVRHDWSDSATASAGDADLIPGLGRSPGRGHGNPLLYSCLENPMDRGAWWAVVHGSQRVGHDWLYKHTCRRPSWP